MAEESDQIRAWARAEGLDVKDAGRLPAAVVAAYREAHGGQLPGQDDGEGGPQWDDAPGLPLAAEDDDPPAPPPPSNEGGNREPEGPPPPSDLDEARDRARKARPTRGKRPGWAGSSRKPRTAKAAPAVTRAERADMEGKLALLLSVPATAVSMVDPACGQAAADALDNIVRKAMPLIVQSPSAVRWLASNTTVVLWLDLLLALQPVAVMFWAHHVAGTVTVIDGQVVPSRRLPDGNVVPLDGQAPAAQQDYSMYSTAQAFGHVPQPRPA
jgi:hypothetical protein